MSVLKFIFILSSILWLNFGITQTDKTTADIENYILINKRDSALLLIKVTPSDDSYFSLLKRLAEQNENSYADLSFFIQRINSRPNINYERLNRFIKTNVPLPLSKDKINLDFVQIKWYQITNLRNETFLDEANSIHAELEKYIAQFNPSNKEVIKAQVLADSHRAVLAVIQKDLEGGLKICKQLESNSRLLKDTSLIILSLYHKSDFLMEEGKLKEYIAVSEESLKLEYNRKQKSDYFIGTIVHLIDAYVYQGSNSDRVNELLDFLYNNEKTKAQSYSLYAKYLGGIDLESVTAQVIFDKFKVKNLVEFCDTTYSMAQADKINSIELYQITRENSEALEAHQFYKEALYYKDVTTQLSQSIYSSELSQTLANYKSNEIVSKKDAEILHEKETSKLLAIIIGLVGGGLLIVFFMFLQKRKQSNELSLRNEKIKAQNEALERKEAEKALLLKEVHHRVKNNFQIITSLLDIQARKSEDEQSKERALEGKNRIKSMALIHQALYQNEELEINIESYIKTLIQEISNSYSEKSPPEISIHTDEMTLDIDTAIPVGLILNELVSNAFKYGFDPKNKQLNISMKKTNQSGVFQLSVSDNGKGLPADFSFEKANSLGLKLVKRLSKQLHGSVEYSNENGFTCTVIFKDSEMRSRID